MATNPASEFIQQLRRTMLRRDGDALSDKQLLENFINNHDEAAMDVLVQRHGPMVWGVCRRLLNHHDAEDAFQATFLVLVRKAASIASRELLANWLYGVAHQTALKARATVAKRKGRERQMTEMPEPAATEEDLWRDLEPVLDQALSRLPDKYRAVIVLCDLEGKTRKEAAQLLGVPEGTVASRMATARTMLAKRLTRHGLAVPGVALATVLTEKAASAGVPTSVVSLTIKAASLFATGQAAATELISVEAIALTEGVLKTMLLTKIKVVTTLLLVAGLLACGGRVLMHQVGAGQEARETKSSTAGNKGRADAPKGRAETTTVTQKIGDRHLTFAGSLKTEFEGLAVALLGSCSAETTFHFGKKEKWEEALKDDHILVTFAKPRQFSMDDPQDSSKENQLLASQILVPIGPVRVPQQVYVRSGDHYRVFSKYQFEVCDTIQKVLQKMR